MISSLLHLVGLRRTRVYYTLTKFRGGGARRPCPPQYANAMRDRPVIFFFLYNYVGAFLLLFSLWIMVGDFLHVGFFCPWGRGVVLGLAPLRKFLRPPPPPICSVIFLLESYLSSRTGSAYQ